MNRERRRRLLDAHWAWSMTEQRSCDRCSCDLDGEVYIGQTMACYEMHCCRSCAIEVVDDTDARKTIECAPITDEEAIVQLRMRAVAL